MSYLYGYPYYYPYYSYYPYYPYGYGYYGYSTPVYGGSYVSADSYGDPGYSDQSYGDPGDGNDSNYDAQPAPQQQPDSEARPQYRPQAATPGSAAIVSGPDANATILFRDGRPSEQISNYVITRDAVYVTGSGGVRETIPMSEIDVEGTMRLNREHGVNFGGASR